MIVHRLPHDPIHLYQYNNDPQAYKNPMGCGAFCTTMALAYYDLDHFGTYAAARQIFDTMRHVPFLGGTFEGENARFARKQGLFTASFDFGTVDDLTAAIDNAAPTILLINPGPFRIGRHDVLLVGYSADDAGNCVDLFVNNPAIQSDAQSAPPGLSYPGNDTIPTGTLQGKWTGCFTPIFGSSETFKRWLRQVQRA